MGDVLKTIVEWVQFLWPLRIVRQWERAGYYVLGRYWRDVGPGLYAICPWFTDIVAIPVVPAIIGTGRQDITMSDGANLSFAATATVRVTSVADALNAVDDYRETVQELIGSVLAEKLAEVDAERLAPERRTRLLGTLERALAKEAGEFGIEVTKLRFTSFVLNARTYRLLTEGGQIAQW
jgi:regulator of protease activity HflC (stomatin/prohibitin superfamily)